MGDTNSPGTASLGDINPVYKSQQHQQYNLPVGTYPVIFDCSILAPVIDILEKNYIPMQLPTDNFSSNSLSSRYNSYFAGPQSSRPIQINNVSTSYGYNPYNQNGSRIMGLDFLPAHQPSPVESFYVMDCDDTTSASTSTHETYNKENRMDNNIQVIGNPGHRTYKRSCPNIDDNLIHEETESEAGISSDEDDDCSSNCGYVHSTPRLNHNTQPKLGFKSIGDIIGYAQVVRAERSEALAQLRAAVDKFNDLRQRNAQLRAQQHHH